MKSSTIIAIFTLSALVDLAQSALSPTQKKLTNTCGLIRDNGYPCEEHFTVTPDGYILRLFRIPPKNNRTAVPVLFGHGMGASSDIFFLQGAKRDLTLILSDNAYDVWIMNARGNFYSRNHTYISPEKPAFWKFSLDEIGRYDMTTSIDYILDVSQQKRLAFVGYSMGATLFFITMSELPKYNEKILVFVGLAPTVLSDPNKKPPLWDYFMVAAANAFVKAKAWELFPRSRLSQGPFYLHQYCTPKNTFLIHVCGELGIAWAGFNYKFTSKNVLQYLGSYNPSGLSALQLLQYVQNIEDGKFRKLSFGKRGNLQHYGTEDPPEYNMSLVTAPVAMYYSHNDYITVDTGVDRTIAALPNVVHVKEYFKYHHVDFVGSRFAWRDVYADVLNLLRDRLAIVNSNNNTSMV